MADIAPLSQKENFCYTGMTMQCHTEKSMRVFKIQFNIVILFEDDSLIVIDKPAGLLSIASETEKERTAYAAVRNYLRKKGEKRQPAVVHRLDKGTSGVMLFVKSALLKQTFMQNWNALILERRYEALAEGSLREAGTIASPIHGAPSVTHWRAIGTRRVQNAEYTLLELELETGRQNQIRIHLAGIAHAVCGDKKFGAKTNPYKRLCLHAKTLSFVHPKTGETLRFTSALPGSKSHLW
ncbi:MAG: RluA family pseudouridine synthase [Treponemataceae bacterium]|nr:MAG: RluA family pseudouridine synthase [Treponemataceae bacterium]